MSLSPEVEHAGKALGLLDASGGLDPSWFSAPTDRLQGILKEPSQRDAFFDLLDDLIPGDPVQGLKPGDKWHPLLADQPQGNVYLTIEPASGGRTLVGVGAQFRSSVAGGMPSAAIFARLPVVSLNSSTVSAVAGTADGPLQITLRVELNWTTPTQAIKLKAVRADVRLAPLAAPADRLRFTIVLEGLDLDGTGAKDTLLDPADLGSEATELILGLLREKLRQIAGSASGEAAAAANHLLPLLGLGGGIPTVPFADLLNGPSALQAWLNSMVASGAISTWLGHLAGLFGSASPVAGAGTTSDPFRVQLLNLGAGGSALEVTAAAANQKLFVGAQAALVHNAGSPAVRVEAQATLVGIPLAGAGSATILPSASVVVRAPGGAGPLVNQPGTISVQSLRGGLRWNQTSLVPLLELLDVDFQGTHYDTIDLTNADSVIAAASAGVQAAILAALGNTGPAPHLAALAGLIKPAGDPAWPFTINPVDLVANPTRAIAAVHRSALLSASHHWGFLLAEAAALVGVADPVDGSGTKIDPWRVRLGPAGPLTLELVAWNAQESGVASDPQLLRLGLRASASKTPWHFWWLAELLAFDLPATGSGNVSLMAGQHASFLLQPAFSTPPVSGIAISSSSAGVTLDWVPGGAFQLRGTVNDLSVTENGTTVNVGSLKFPPTAPFDVTNPAPSLGINVAPFETLARLLATRAAFGYGGIPGLTITGLLGVHRKLAGFQADWPLLQDPGAAGSLFTQFDAALRDWLERVAINVSADGSPFLPQALLWLRGLVADALPASPSQVPLSDQPLAGSGVYEDPWALPVAGGGSRPVELLFWLEPEGPPSTWAAALPPSLGATGNFVDLVDRARALGPFIAPLRDALAFIDVGGTGAALETLATLLSSSDGVVPLSSQIPTGGTWTSGTPLTCAHHKQPSDSSAISQILAQLNVLNPPVGQRAVLLVGPAFADRTAWSAFLGQAEAQRPGSTKPDAHFDLRIPNADPLNIDLAPVTTIADYYTADLQDSGVGNLVMLSGQIGRVVDRIRQLRPGVKVTLVAHSTAGVAARAYTAANPTKVQGLITLGTPHAGAPLTVLRDQPLADAVRLLDRLALPLAAGAIKDSLEHLKQALDGFLPPIGPGQPPRPRPYPIGSFAGTDSTDTAGVPAFALGGTMAGDLFATVKAALVSNATTAAGAARPTPTHVGIGIRGRLPFPDSSPGEIAVNGTVRVDAFRVALHGGAPAPPHPLHAITVNAELRRLGGWLVGAPFSFNEDEAPLIDTRVRWAELGVVISTNGGLHVTPSLRVHDISFHSDTTPLAQLGDAIAEPLLGEVIRALNGPSVGPAPAALLDAFAALGLAVPDAVTGGLGLSSDAFAAIQVDAPGYLEPKLLAALNLPQGFLGISGPTGGPWKLPIGTGAIELYLAKDPGWRAGVRTTADAALTLGGGIAATLDASLAIPAMTGSLDVDLSYGGLSLSRSQSTGSITLSLLPWIDSLPISPFPSPAVLTSTFSAALPRIMLSSVVSALVEPTLGPLFKVGPIDQFLASPGGSFTSSRSLGNGSTLDSAKINQLLQVIAAAAGSPPGPGLGLPTGIRVTASGTGTITLRVATTTAIAGVLDFELDANIDPLLHVTPAGTITLHLPLPGVWGNSTITFGLSAQGVTLVVNPTGSAPIQLLPTFTGLGALSGAAQALLPAVLDAIVNAFGGPPPKLVELSVNLAKALDLADAGGSFQARANNWKGVLAGNWLTSRDAGVRSAAATAFVALFNDAASPLNGAIPGTIGKTDGLVTWTISPGTGTITIAAGWDASGPSVLIQLAGVKVATGPLRLTFKGGFANNAINAEARLGFSLQSSIGVSVEPQLAAVFNGTSFEVDLLPLGAAGASAVDIELLPSPAVHISSSGPTEFLQQWVLPVVSDLLLHEASAKLNTAIWTGGPTLRAILKSAGIIDNADHLLHPTIEQMVLGLLKGVATNVAIPITPTLKLSLVDEIPTSGGAKRLGVRIRGHQEFKAGQIEVGMLFGEPATWITDSTKGVTLYLLNSTGGFTLNPLLEVTGLGVSLRGAGGSPLINTSVLRLGGGAGYVFFTLNFSGSVSLTNFGAGVELDEFGIPLGQALGGNTGGDNPVAASLLQSDSSGDPNPVNPAINVVFAYRNNTVIFEIAGAQGALWIGVRRAFGPIYIEQIGIEPREAKSKVALLVDGSVQVNGLTVGVDDLSVVIPLKKLTSPGDWTLDLRGLAVGYKGEGIAVAGGLVKNPGPPIQYDGMLQVDIAGRGFTAVGSYARPTDAMGEYTSLFIFVSLPITLGGPPAFFVTGLGGGAGYNRQLLVPVNVTDVPGFLLVAAIDNPSFANDPMRALRDMALSIPPKRGAFWLAAGVRFTSFVIVQSTAVIYVAVDRGFEIGILGVSRMALPTASFAIAQVELALKARFNSVEGILSIQAQLTDNSYLFHPSCQLTGGFAFFVWFPRGQFVLTIGGYHPAFQKPPEFPDVPRLGFRWTMGPVSIKGEAYFALTNTCVMAGGRLEAVYSLGPIRAWFIAWADFLVSWDPFHYDISIGLQVGVRVEFEVCFIGCATIRLGFTLGASVHIIGPPLYAEVKVDAYIATITVHFGDKPQSTPVYITDFNVFKTKYLTAGDANGKAVSMRVAQGLLPPDPPGAQPLPGTTDQPWKLGIEFAFTTETRMPASKFSSFLAGESNASGGPVLDLAPMDELNVVSNHDVRITRKGDGSTPPMDAQHFAIQQVSALFPEATWHWTDPNKQKAAANTIEALGGLTIVGSAFLQGQTQLIQIAGHVDDDPSLAKPLPFATNTPQRVGVLQTIGTQAETLAVAIAGATSAKMLAAAEAVLTSGGLFAEARKDAGIPVNGLTPLTTQTLRRYRSSPPLVAPLSTGLTMKPVGLAAPPAVTRIGETSPVGLGRPRLKAVLRRKTQVSDDAPIALHTSVTRVVTTGIGRTSPPKPLPQTGARLQRVPARRAPRPTDTALGHRTLHHPDLAVLAGPAHVASFEKAVDQVQRDGVVLPAGTTHVWDLPPAKITRAIAIRGNAGARVVFLNRAGRVVSDTELIATKEVTLTIPADAEAVAVACLGAVPAGVNVKPALGAVTFGFAPSGGAPAAGWQTGNAGDMVSASTILARGATLRLPRPHTSLHKNQKVSEEVVSFHDVVRDQVGTETRLPLGVTVVAVLLDGQDVTAAADGDLAIATDGAQLATPPIPVGGGRRRMLLYDVVKRDTAADRLSISVGSSQGWRVAGVVGLTGRAIEWANRFHGEVPEHLVLDGPLTPDGSVVVRLIDRTPTPTPTPAPRVPPTPAPRIPGLPTASTAPKTPSDEPTAPTRRARKSPRRKG